MKEEKANELGLYIAEEENKEPKKSKMSNLSKMMRKLLDCCKE